MNSYFSLFLGLSLIFVLCFLFYIKKMNGYLKLILDDKNRYFEDEVAKARKVRDETAREFCHSMYVGDHEFVDNLIAKHSSAFDFVFNKKYECNLCNDKYTEKERKDLKIYKKVSEKGDTLYLCRKCNFGSR